MSEQVNPIDWGLLGSAAHDYDVRSTSSLRDQAKLHLERARTALSESAAELERARRAPSPSAIVAALEARRREWRDGYARSNNWGDGYQRGLDDAINIAKEQTNERAS